MHIHVVHQDSNVGHYCDVTVTVTEYASMHSLFFRLQNKKKPQAQIMLAVKRLDSPAAETTMWSRWDCTCQRLLMCL